MSEPLLTHSTSNSHQRSFKTSRACLSVCTDGSSPKRVLRNLTISDSPQEDFSINTKTRDAFFQRNILYFCIALGIIAHFARGCNTGFARYLQTEIDHGLSTGFSGLMVISLRTTVSWVLIAPFSIATVKRTIKMKQLFWFVVLHMAVSLFNVYAARFTDAYVVQTVLLIYPFFLALILRWLNYQGTRFVAPTFLFVAIGVCLSLMGDSINNASFELTIFDAVGIILACSAAFALSMLMFIYAKTEELEHFTGLIFIENFVQSVVITTVSIGIDHTKWIEIWGELSSQDQVVLPLAILCYVVSSFVSTMSIFLVGVLLFNALSPTQLFTATAFSVSPLLFDRIEALNVFGIILMIVTFIIHFFFNYRGNVFEIDKKTSHLAGEFGITSELIGLDTSSEKSGDKSIKWFYSDNSDTDDDNELIIK